jgi:hypothetical protein
VRAAVTVEKRESSVSFHTDDSAALRIIAGQSSASVSRFIELSWRALSTYERIGGEFHILKREIDVGFGQRCEQHK